METLGACVIANDLPYSGQAKDILQMRIDGKSWKEIGEVYGKSPSGARKLFTDLTGITDYKIKGSDLLNLAKSGNIDSLKIPKSKKKKPKPDVDYDPSQWGSQGQPWKGPDSHNASPPSAPAGSNIANHAAQKQIDTVDFKISPGKIDKDNLDYFTGKYVNGIDFDDNDLDEKIYKVIKGNKEGKTYTQIKHATGWDYDEIDRIIWADNLALSGGDVWKAYNKKPTSNRAIDAVTDKVMQARKMGATIGDIHEYSGIPKDIIDKILDGQWKPSPWKTPNPSFYKWDTGLPDPKPQPISSLIAQPSSKPTPTKPKPTKPKPTTVDAPEAPQYGKPTGTKPKPNGNQPPPPGRVMDSQYYGKDPDYPILDIDAMIAQNPTLTGDEISAIRAYTGTYYQDVNNYLRNGKLPPGRRQSDMDKYIRTLDSALLKGGQSINRGFTVTRGMDARAFGLSQGADLSHLKNTIYRDKGFQSTSNHTAGVFENEVRLEIKCPPGTPGVYAQPHSAFSRELEFLMGRNVGIQIESVTRAPPPPGCKWYIKGRVIVHG